MDQTARAAFIIAQAACAAAEIAAMQVTNDERMASGDAPAYGADDFRAVPDSYGISHNAAVSYLMGA